MVRPMPMAKSTKMTGKLTVTAASASVPRNFPTQMALMKL